MCGPSDYEKDLIEGALPGIRKGCPGTGILARELQHLWRRNPLFCLDNDATFAALVAQNVCGVHATCAGKLSQARFDIEAWPGIRFYISRQKWPGLVKY